MSQGTHNALDATAIGALAATLIGWLPNATAVLVFVVALIRFFETATVRKALKRLKAWLSG